MGVDLAAVLAGLTGVGNLMGQGANLAGTGMSMGNALFDYLRYFQRNSDPTLNAIRAYDVNRFNQSPYGPYGDVGGGYGGMWGVDDAGNPVQFGDMGARQTNYMLQNNPAMAAIAQLNRASSMERPGMASFADIMSGSAEQAAPQPYMHDPNQSRRIQPVQTNNVYSGIPAPTGPQPQIAAPQGGVGTIGRTATSGIRERGQNAAQAIADITGPPSPSPGGQPPLRGSIGTGPPPGRRPLLPGLARGAALGFISQGGFGGRRPILGNFQEGTDFVPETGTYMLHEGERVIPADENMQRLMMAVGMGIGSNLSNTIQDRRANMEQQKIEQRQADQQKQYDQFNQGRDDMPSYQTGTPYIPQTGPARLHRGEAVIPQNSPLARSKTGGVNPNAPGGSMYGGAGQVSPPPPPMKPSTRPQVPAVAAPQQKMQTGPGIPQGVPTTPPQTAAPSIDQGRVNVLQGLLANPESLGADTQRMMFQRMADQAEVARMAGNREATERLAGRGFGNTGMLDYNRMMNNLAAQGQLTNAMRDIGILSATQNFGDRMNVANLALNQQLGMGQQAMQYQALQNELFNQDRAYDTALAGALFDLGRGGQQQQANLLGQLGALTGSGLSQQDALSRMIYGQTQGRYADPNISAVQQFGYAPNPYLQYLAAQDANNGGDSGDIWGTLGQVGGAALGTYLGGPAGGAAGSAMANWGTAPIPY